MLRATLVTAAVTTALLAPLVSFAEGHEQHEQHDRGHHFNAPEIDGSNVILGIALVGGALSLLKRREKKEE